MVPRRDLLLFAGLVGDEDVAAEEVRIGHIDRAFGTVELDIVVAVAERIPARADRDDRARMELQDAVDRGRGADLDLLAVHRRAGRGDGAVRLGAVGEGRDALDRPDQVDEVGDVVRPDVEHGTGADLEEEVRVRVPVFHAAAHHVRGAVRDLAQLLAVDDVAHLLVRAAEEGVGRRADIETALVGLGLELLAFLEREHEGLLGIGMLARRNRIERDLVVRRRHREIDDDVDLGVLQHLVGRHRGDAELLAARLGRGRHDVGDAADLDALEQRREPQIGRGDIAGTHDADAVSLRHDQPHCLTVLMEVVAKRIASLGLSCSITK